MILPLLSEKQRSIKQKRLYPKKLLFYVQENVYPPGRFACRVVQG